MTHGLEKLIYAELSYKIIGVLFAVHNELGRYRNEKQYADAIERYLKLYDISYEREKSIPPSFVGEYAGRNKVDFLVGGKIIVELKAKRVVERSDYYQAKRYLTAFGKKLCILVNFQDKFLRPKRILNSMVREWIFAIRIIGI